MSTKTKTKGTDTETQFVKPDRTVDRMVRHKLSDTELLEIARSNAEAMIQLRQVEADKKQAMDDFKAQISAQEALVASLSDKINSGVETRKVKCGVYMDTPEIGKKEIIRLDLLERVAIEPMTDEDKQVNLDLED